MGALTGREKQEMRRAGFLFREINVFNNAKTPDGKNFQNLNTSSKNWRDMLQSRVDWVKRLESYGWSKEQIINEILAYYTRDKKRTSFDFLQMESSPHARGKRASESELARRKEKKLRIKRNLGRAYGARKRVHLRRPS